MINGAPAQQQPPIVFPPQLFQRLLVFDLGQQAITIGGGEVRVDLERQGFLLGLIVRVQANYDVAIGGSGIAARGPWTALARFRLQPPGPQPIYNCSAWSVHAHNKFFNFHPHRKGSVAEILPYNEVNGPVANSGSDDVWPNTSNVTGQVGELWYFLPLVRSMYDPRGILPLGNTTTTTLYITPATAVADIFATPANVTFPAAAAGYYRVRVWQLAYTTPPRGADVLVPDLSWVISYEDQDQVVAATGSNSIKVEPRDTILRMIHTLVLNAALNSADINTVSLRFDRTYVHQATTAAAQFKLQEWNAGRRMPRGVVAYDEDTWADADGSIALVLRGDAAIPFNLAAAPWINTAEIATIESLIDIAAGATLGTGPRIYTTVARLARVTG